MPSLASYPSPTGLESSVTVLRTRVPAFAKGCVSNIRHAPDSLRRDIPPGPLHRLCRSGLSVRQMLPAVKQKSPTVAGVRTACSGTLYAQIIALHQLVLAEFLCGVTFEGDGAVDDDVPSVRYLGSLLEVLLGHEHR
jgi:hypothetical protein